MKFRSFSDRPARVASPSGSPERQLYTRKIDSAGNKSLEKSGKENVYLAIQLAANGNLAKDLVARATRGDESAIPSADSLTYADITGAPKSLLDAENRLIDARSLFDSLPVEVRNKYGNNFRNFLVAVDDGSWLSEAKAEKAARDNAAANAAAVDAAKPPVSDDVLAYIQKKINFGGS